MQYTSLSGPIPAFVIPGFSWQRRCIRLYSVHYPIYRRMIIFYTDFFERISHVFSNTSRLQRCDFKIRRFHRHGCQHRLRRSSDFARRRRLVRHRQDHCLHCHRFDGGLVVFCGETEEIKFCWSCPRTEMERSRFSIHACG